MVRYTLSSGDKMNFNFKYIDCHKCGHSMGIDSINQQHPEDEGGFIVDYECKNCHSSRSLVYEFKRENKVEGLNVD